MWLALESGSWAQALTLGVFLFIARATLEILIPDFVKQTSEEKPKDSEELEVSFLVLLCLELWLQCSTCATAPPPPPRLVRAVDLVLPAPGGFHLLIFHKRGNLFVFVQACPSCLAMGVKNAHCQLSGV